MHPPVLDIPQVTLDIAEAAFTFVVLDIKSTISQILATSVFELIQSPHQLMFRSVPYTTSSPLERNRFLPVSRHFTLQPRLQLDTRECKVRLDTIRSWHERLKGQVKMRISRRRPIGMLASEAHHVLNPAMFAAPIDPSVPRIQY